MIRGFTWVVAVAALASCSLGAFDDRRENAWSMSQGAPSGVDGDHGVLVATVNNDRPGIHFAAIAAGPAGLATHSFDERGASTSRGIDLSDLIPATVDLSVATVVGSPENIAGADGLIAIGGLGEVNQILLFDAATGTTGPTFRKAIDASACGSGINNLGQGMAFGLTDLGAPDAVDLVAIAGPDLMVFPDIDADAGAPTCFRCTRSGGTNSLDVVSYDYDDDGVDEILISGGGASGFEASLIETHQNQGQPCFDFATPQIGGLPAPGGEADFGAKMAVGDFEEDNTPEVLFWAPNSGVVYLFRSLSGSGPSGPPDMLAGVGQSIQFGTAIAFGNVDGVDGDEILIGDPGASPDGVTSAGKVDIFGYSADEVELVNTIFDSDPQPDQRFGRSISVGEFTGTTDDTDLVIVGALGEVFTYFRATQTAADPRSD